MRRKLWELRVKLLEEQASETSRLKTVKLKYRIEVAAAQRRTEEVDRLNDQIQKQQWFQAEKMRYERAERGELQAQLQAQL